jgi:plasmid maintenance system killer protein
VWLRHQFFNLRIRAGSARARKRPGREKLRGKLANFHSIRVNKQWRLIFQWDGSRGEATSVYLDDHSYT